MLILSLDFETTFSTPVNAEMARPLEIGAVLYDTELKVPVSMFSEMLVCESHPTSPRELVELTGITDEMRSKYGIAPERGFLMLNSLISKADYVLGHNIREFDQVLYLAECERLVVTPVIKPLIDTKTDLPLPSKIKSLKLTHLCMEHGFINPFSHRALFDALSTLKLLECYSLDEVIALSNEPNVKVVASVSYNEKHLAKDRGYYWEAEEKRWAKQMKKAKAEKEKSEAPFAVQLLYAE